MHNNSPLHDHRVPLDISPQLANNMIDVDGSETSALGRIQFRAQMCGSAAFGLLG